MKPPSHWPRSMVGFSDWPQSQTIRVKLIVVSPVITSTSTSEQAAPKMQYPARGPPNQPSFAPRCVQTPVNCSAPTVQAPPIPTSSFQVTFSPSFFPALRVSSVGFSFSAALSIASWMAAQQPSLVVEPPVMFPKEILSVDKGPHRMSDIGTSSSQICERW